MLSSSSKDPKIFHLLCGRSWIKTMSGTLLQDLEQLEEFLVVFLSVSQKKAPTQGYVPC